MSIRLPSLFEFGRGHSLLEPLRPLYKKYYWCLIAFAAVFWAALIFFSYHYEHLYSGE